MLGFSVSSGRNLNYLLSSTPGNTMNLSFDSTGLRCGGVFMTSFSVGVSGFESFICLNVIHIVKGAGWEASCIFHFALFLSSSGLHSKPYFFH